MLDIRLLRTDLDNIIKNIAKRSTEIDWEIFKSLETKRKILQTETQNLQNKRNKCSKNIGQAKANGEDIESLLLEVSQLGDQLTSKEKELTKLLDSLHEFCMHIPNIIDDQVPIGKTEEDNIELRRSGKPGEFNFTPKSHTDLQISKTNMNFNIATKIAGSRFVVLQDKLAKLQRALIQFMLDIHTKQHDYEEIYVPYLVNSQTLIGTGQLPKFAKDQFKIAEHDLWLVPTAEAPVTNIFRDTIIDKDKLPLKYVCHSPCFRSEAGSYGKDTKGMFRQHQFEKVELVQIIEPNKSQAAHEELTEHAERILQQLNLPYRVVILCAGDLGFGATKTYDLEVWLPSQNRYREISSCSNFMDFQARRMMARYRNNAQDKNTNYVHTINGSGLAVGRTLIAILENYQDEKGRVAIPEVLKPYMQGVDYI